MKWQVDFQEMRLIQPADHTRDNNTKGLMRCLNT